MSQRGALFYRKTLVDALKNEKGAKRGSFKVGTTTASKKKQGVFSWDNRSDLTAWISPLDEAKTWTKPSFSVLYVNLATKKLTEVLYKSIVV